jgi:thioredoxin-related protein
MNFSVVLFKDSNCDLCKLMQKELMDNPPNAEITILHIKHERSKTLANLQNITEFPTTIIYCGEDEITRRIGFIDSETIDKIIKQYETERVV